MKQMTLFILSTVLFFSCKKDDKCEISTNSIAGTYKITAAKYKASASASEVDYYNVLFPDACERDDILTFQTNGTYQIKDIGLVCSPSGDDDGSWSVSGNNMVIDGDPTYIENFDCKTLTVSSKDVQDVGDKLQITLSRQ